MEPCQFDQLHLQFLVACPSLVLVLRGIWQNRVCFWKTSSTVAVVFHNLVFWVNHPKPSSFLWLEDKEPQTFCWCTELPSHTKGKSITSRSLFSAGDVVFADEVSEAILQEGRANLWLDLTYNLEVWKVTMRDLNLLSILAPICTFLTQLKILGMIQGQRAQVHFLTQMKW